MTSKIISHVVFDNLCSDSHICMSTPMLYDNENFASREFQYTEGNSIVHFEVSISNRYLDGFDESMPILKMSSLNFKLKIYYIYYLYSDGSIKLLYDDNSNEYIWKLTGLSDEDYFITEIDVLSISNIKLISNSVMNKIYDKIINTGINHNISIIDREDIGKTSDIFELYIESLLKENG